MKAHQFNNTEEPSILSLAADIVSENLYAYCGNNPINCMDIDSMFWKKVGNTIGNGIKFDECYLLMPIRGENMKKEILLVIVIINSLILCSCRIGGTDVINEQKTRKQTTENVMKTVQEQNREEIKSFFSNNIIDSVENIDKEIDNFFEYVKGDFVAFLDEEFNEDGGAIIGTTREGGNEFCDRYTSYDVKTTVDTYRIAIYEVLEDTANNDNMGIHSLYVIKMNEDTDLNYIYRGDDKDTPGINIGIPNKIPDWDK